MSGLGWVPVLVGRGDGGGAPFPQCPLCGCYGGGAHGGLCPNIGQPWEQWLHQQPAGLELPAVRLRDCPHCHALVDTHMRVMLPVALMDPPPRQAERYQLRVRWQCWAVERHHGEWTEPTDG